MKVVACLLLLWAVPCLAQMVPEREVEIIQSLYDTGKYADAARRANESLSLANFEPVQRQRLHEIAALSAFNLGDVKAAQSAFLQLLRVNPDAVLDPFAVPPAAIKVFEQIRKENTDTLNLLRQQIAIRVEQEKRATAERERLKREEEDSARKAVTRSNEITVRTIEKRSMLMNFVPFGVGQFQQGRNSVGAMFAVSEGVMAVLSIVSFFAIEGLFTTVTREWTDRLTDDAQNGVFTLRTREIPADRKAARDVWSGLKYGTGIAFYALWATGVGEALWHHEDQIVTEHKETLAPTKPTARLNLYPMPGGLGANVTIAF